MKQIFNNLRAILTRHKENMPVVVLAEMLAEIDEAEAKWEAECCVVNHFNGNRIVVEVHGNQFYRRCVDEWKYCPYCGKPIKISEV